LFFCASQHNIFFFCGYRLQQVADILEEERSLDVLQDPTRIFNGDKSSFQFFPVINNYHHDAPVISLLLAVIDYYARKFLVE
jgi:hypothetical protein